VRPELAVLAEDPELLVSPPEGSTHIVNGSYCVVIAPERRWASVCRLRLPSHPAAFRRTLAEIEQLVADAGSVMWNVGSSSTPPELRERLREHGLRDPDPPFEPVCGAFALDHEPPGVDGVEVTRITSLQEHMVGLEIMLASAQWSESAAARARATAEDTFQRRTRRGAFQWLARVDDVPVAVALADNTRAGLFLNGGSTLPSARGRGCYRALVRARWDEAVRLGTPGLAVQAQYGTSAPILRRLGFAEVAVVHTLQR
jgi:GNAT superfamily N-acetyltransferase